VRVELTTHRVTVRFGLMSLSRSKLIIVKVFSFELSSRDMKLFANNDQLSLYLRLSVMTRCTL